MTLGASGQGETIYLSHLKKGDCASVLGMADHTDAEQAMLKRRLTELGFVSGETIRIVAEAFPRRDPIAVRLGNTTFALRRHEAAMIRVTPPANLKRR